MNNIYTVNYNYEKKTDYYIKYIKYKNKYINIKKQFVGQLGTKTCPQDLKETKEYSVCYFLRNFNCVFEQIKSHIPEKLKEFNFCILQEDNKKNEYQITVKDLKSRRFLISFLKDRFPLKEIKKAGYKIFELWIDGFTIEQLKQDLEEEYNEEKDKEGIIKTWINYNKDKPKYKDLSEKLRTDYIKKEFKMAGFLKKEFINNGYEKKAFLKKLTPNEKDDLAKIFFDDPEITKLLKPPTPPRVDRVITVEDIRNIIRDNDNNNDKIVDALLELNRERREKINLSILFAAGINLEILLIFGIYSHNDLIKHFSIEDFKNVSKQEYIDLSYFNFYDLLAEKYPLQYMFNYFNKDDFKDFDIKTLVESGINLYQFLKKGYSLAELTDFFCFTLSDLEDLLDYRIILNIGKITPELKERGFTVKNLFNQFKLEKIGVRQFKIKIKDYQINLSKLLELGFTIEELKDLPNSALILRKKGYMLSDFKNAGFSIESLVNATYNVKELKEAGFTANELKKDINIVRLKNAGFTAEELIGANYDIILFYLVGFPIEKITELFEEKDLCKLELYKQNIEILKKLLIDYNVEKKREIKGEIKKIIIKIQKLCPKTVSLKYIKELKVPIEIMLEIFTIEDLKLVFSFKEFLELNVDRILLAQSYKRDVVDDNEDSERGKKYRIKELMKMKTPIEQILRHGFTIEKIEKTLHFYFYDPNLKMNYFNPDYKIFKPYADKIKLKYEKLE